MACRYPSLYAFILVISFSIQTFQAEFPKSVIQEMSRRDMRYQHLLWHTIRANYYGYDWAVQQKISDLGWEPPRPSIDFSDRSLPTIVDNNSGEDFLYMHRNMIKRVKEIIREQNETYELTSWEHIPLPGDSEWPVPDPYEVTGDPGTTDQINWTKTDDFYYKYLKPSEDSFKDEDNLRSMTLGELGSNIEDTVHTWLHFRFSSKSSLGYRPEFDDPLSYIDPKWDAPAYNWLKDLYSAQVNPLFWKLHGWIDDRIEDWRKANGVDEIEWIGTWLGGPMESIMDLFQVTKNSVKSQGKRGKAKN